MEFHDYTFWFNLTRRQTHTTEEAEDLLQEALFVAVQQGRLDLEQEENRKWLTGVIRNLAKMEARSAKRRKKREEAAHLGSANLDIKTDEHEDAKEAILNLLSPGARKVAVLAMHGLERAEICSILKITDAALRQRIRSIRKVLGDLPADLQKETLGMAYASRLSREARAKEFPLGLLRKALLRHLKSAWENHRESFGTHDPSGHLIVIKRSL